VVTLYHTIQLISIIKDELIADYLLGIIKKYQYDSRRGYCSFQIQMDKNLF